MWTTIIVIIIALFVLAKFMEYKDVQRIRRDAAKKYLEENQNKSVKKSSDNSIDD